jgi:uncharacterized repeat protein (TIGR01451 family)
MNMRRHLSFLAALAIAAVCAAPAAAQTADLQVFKADSVDPIAAGGTQTYTITVINNGPDDAEFVTLDDTLPAGTTFLSLSSPAGWTCTTPAVGSGGTVDCSTDLLAAFTTPTFTLQVVFDSGLQDGTVVTNTATVSAETPEANPGDESGSTDSTVGTPTDADLAVTKTGTPDPVFPGDNLTYTLTVVNNGPADAATVSLDDTLPSQTNFQSLSSPGGWSCTAPAVGATGDVNCSIATLAPGSAVFTLVVQVDATATPHSTIVNTALVSSPTNDPNPDNGSATAFNQVASPPVITATKTVSGQLQPGGAIAYTVILTNSGDAGQTDNPGAEFTDVLPAELTLVSAAATSGAAVATVATNTVTWNGAIPAGASVTVTLNATIKPGTPLGTNVSNQGTFAYDADNNGTNEASGATDDPTLPGAADPTVFQVSSPASVSGTKTVAGQLSPGGTVTYTVVLSNSGPNAQSDNPGAEFTDVLPSQLTLVSATATAGTALATVATNTVTWNGSIAAGGSVTITIKATISSGAAIGTSISNQGTLAFDADGNGTNEASGVTDDPAAAGASNPTTFVVGAQSVLEIPTLDTLGLAVLALLLATGGAGLLRRKKGRA